MPHDIESTSKNGSTYSAPALDKGLDILELLSGTDGSLSQREIAGALDRSVGEIYRMLTCLVRRDYLALYDDSYTLTTKLFELAHQRPPTQRLLVEARPYMDGLAARLDQSCHLTVWGPGHQVVIAKVDVPSGMGFGVRVGSELDVTVSASGRVLLAFQDDAVIEQRLAQALARRPEHVDAKIIAKLQKIRRRGFESARSIQVRGLYAVSYPILDSYGHAVAALTVPFAERLDLKGRASVAEVEASLGDVARELTQRLGGRPTT